MNGGRLLPALGQALATESRCGAEREPAVGSRGGGLWSAGGGWARSLLVTLSVSGATGGAPTGLILALVSLQKSALIVQGPREVKKRELVFLQFRLNESSEDFSAIDYLLFSSFQEFLQRWRFQSVPGLPHTVSCPLAHPGPGWASGAVMGAQLQGLTWSLAVQETCLH